MNRVLARAMINMRKSAKSRNMFKYFTTSGILRHDKRPVKCQLPIGNCFQLKLLVTYRVLAKCHPLTNEAQTQSTRQPRAPYAIFKLPSSSLISSSRSISWALDWSHQLPAKLMDQQQRTAQSQSQSHCLPSSPSSSSSSVSSSGSRNTLLWFYKPKKADGKIQTQALLGSRLISAFWLFAYFRGAFSSINFELEFLFIVFDKPASGIQVLLGYV